NARIERLTPTARTFAQWIAVVGTRASHELLLVVTELDDAAVLAALDELRTAGMLLEHSDGTLLYHELSHPLLRQALASLHGAARERNMHAAVANALELVHGPRAEQNADQL